MAGAGVIRERFEGSTRTDDQYDDGLVHNHDWAASSRRPSPAAGFAAANRSRAYAAVEGHERHDDGLVHNHDWAVTGK
jgi:hypothetical protein